MAEENKTAPKKFERIYTVPFGKAYEYLHTRRTRRAMKMLRAYLARHCKVDEKAIRISAGVNDAMWRDGIQKPPRRLKVRAVLDEGKLTAWLVGEEEKIRAQLAEIKAAQEKAKKELEAKQAAAAKKEEKKDAKTESKPAEAKPASAHAESQPAEKKAEHKAQPANKASDVKPTAKTSGGMSGGRKQI